MFPFSREPKDHSADTPAAAPKAPEAHPLDGLTGGVFSAATSGERAQRLRDWLATNPSPEQMQDVYKELSVKDKGATKALREKLDELRRAKNQQAVAVEWQAKAEALLQAPRLNIADAMAWQRDAAKAGAPLSREPLSTLRARLADLVKKVEDLQQQVMVQREAALLLAQRIELFSTKSWADAQAQQSGLERDVGQWRDNTAQLMTEGQWASVDTRFSTQLEAAQTQLMAVWEAFSAALAQAVAAAADSAAPLPPVPVWADELRVARGEAPAAAPEKPAKPKIDPAQREAAQKAVEAGVMLLEQAVAAGHTKNMHSATQSLRQSLKTHGRLIDDALEARVHAALVSAGELEGWQRWSADKVREQLVARAEALLIKRKKKAPAADANAAVPEAGAHVQAEGQAEVQADVSAPVQADAQPAAPAEIPAAPATAASADALPDTPDQVADAVVTEAPAAASPARSRPAPSLAADEEWAPAMGGRKLQETIRKLREEWKTADQGGAPNHALWKRFDRALNTAHKFVDEWLGKVRAEAAEHRRQRLALIEEVKAWAADHASANGDQEGQHTDWKAFNRQIHQFSDRWRNAGHLSEKQFAELQPQWKAAIHQAAQPLEEAQKHSMTRRQAMIAEADLLGAAPTLRIDAVKALQQRWQAEAQAIPLDRRQEQKLWDAFRKPIDEAFNRKSIAREKQQAAISAHDQAVLDAAKALEAANATGDAQQIRAAMTALEAATRGQAAAQATQADAPSAAGADGAAAEPTTEAPVAAEGAEAASAGETATAPKPPKPLIAMRGDDRPGAQRPATQAAQSGARRDGRPGRDGGRDAGRDGSDARRGDARRGERPGREDRAPRLGDAAFRAQREAVEHAQAQLRKLAAQAHGEALTQLLQAWSDRQPDQVPPAQELGRAVTAAVRNTWVQAVAQASSAAQPADARAAEALLRLEMAAETPTPAEHLAARRALQLQLLTRRHDPAPADTWAQDTATVLSAAYEPAQARRLQAALKALLSSRR